MQIGAATRLIALLGNPVAHSLSPVFQNAAIRATGLDAVYLAVRCDADRVRGLMLGIAGAGGGGNVTVPHKRLAAETVDQATDAVRRTGACNTFWAEAGRLVGDNTDVQGFAAAARERIGSPAGARVLVIGAGGAARAAVAALLAERADAVHVLNRSAATAESLRDALDPRARRVLLVKRGADLRREGFDLVVNATPLGLEPDDPLPLRFDDVGRIGAVLDMVCRPVGTPWVAAAKERGIDAGDGTEMLIRQGAASFRRWFGREAPVDVMRAALADHRASDRPTAS